MFRSALVLILAVLGLLATTTMPAQESSTRINVSGSDTMNLLTQRFAEAYQAANPGVEISVRGGGSGVGINDLMEGLVDIAQSSRSMKPEEIERMKAGGKEVEEHIVGLDGLAVAVHVSSPVQELSLNQIKAIYTGSVQRWSQLNPEWPDERIIVYSRESNSGTYDFFKEHVLRGADFGNGISYLAATAAIANSVGDNRNAIGFGGIAYFVRVPNARIVAVSAGRGQAAVLPVEEGGTHPKYSVIQDGSYPISRPLQYYTTTTASPAAKAFLAWMKTPEGQKIVEQIEYIPLGDSALAGEKNDSSE